MNSTVAKAHMLTSQLLAHHKEGLTFDRIDNALALEKQLQAAAGRMYKHCVDIAINEGCGDGYQCATDQLAILYRALGWDAEAILAKVANAVSAVYLHGY